MERPKVWHQQLLGICDLPQSKWATDWWMDGWMNGSGQWMDDGTADYGAWLGNGGGKRRFLQLLLRLHLFLLPVPLFVLLRRLLLPLFPIAVYLLNSTMPRYWEFIRELQCWLLHHLPKQTGTSERMVVVGRGVASYSFTFYSVKLLVLRQLTFVFTPPQTIYFISFHSVKFYPAALSISIDSSLVQWQRQTVIHSFVEWWNIYLFYSFCGLFVMQEIPFPLFYYQQLIVDYSLSVGM